MIGHFVRIIPVLSAQIQNQTNIETANKRIELAKLYTLHATSAAGFLVPAGDTKYETVEPLRNFDSREPSTKAFPKAGFTSFRNKWGGQRINDSPIFYKFLFQFDS